MIRKTGTKLPSAGSLLPIIITCYCTASSAQNFSHPGGLHTQADKDRMKVKVAAAESPWIDGWNRLLHDRKAQSNYGAWAALETQSPSVIPAGSANGRRAGARKARSIRIYSPNEISI